MTKSETRVCQNCKTSFVIDASDFAFYEKISVPAPTWCPECRMKRRMIWRNERMLYKRTSNLSGTEIISQYPSGVPFPVYGVPEYFAREWEIPEKEYDPERSFFEQFGELMKQVPRAALLTDLQSFENGSMYQNSASRNKNCYMVSASGDNKDCMYGSNVDYCANVIDGLGLRQVQYSYDSVDCMQCTNVFFSDECRNCTDGYFLFECKDCTSCFGCAHLRHKSYCWFNEQLFKGEYQKRFEAFRKGISLSKIDVYKKKLEDLKARFPYKFGHINSNSVATCTGDYIVSSKNVKNSYFVIGSENSRYCSKLIMSKECWDMTDWGDPAELCYESITVGKGANRVLFSNNCWPECRDIFYCDSCSNSHHLFGCIGLKNASYRVLNKQYSKKEYETLVLKIIADMKRRGEYGEFFPLQLAPFAYNESIAQEYFPITKKDAKGEGYLWKKLDAKDYEVTKNPDDLPEYISDVDDSILNEVIRCEHKGKCSEQCTSAFRFVPEELAFYRHTGFPLPHLCPNCRHYQRFKHRNPLKLWHRKCQCEGVKSGAYKNTTSHFHGAEKCPNEFETSYSPERKEIIYCEACYNAEVV